MASDSHLTRRPLVLAAVLGAAALVAVLALYMGVSDRDGVIGSQGEVYSEAVAGTWQRVNPLFSNTNEVDADLSQLVFSGLVRLGPDGQVQPDLAELPQLSDEGRTYTFKLRKNLVWTDGQPLTASDVEFTIRRLMAPDFRGD